MQAERRKILLLIFSILGCFLSVCSLGFFQKPHDYKKDPDAAVEMLPPSYANTGAIVLICHVETFNDHLEKLWLVRVDPKTSIKYILDIPKET